MFAGLSILFFLIDAIFQRELKSRFNSIFFLVLFLIFLSLLISELVNIRNYNSVSFKSILKNEMGDMWVIFIIPVASFHFRNAKKRNKIVQFLLIAFGMLFLSGFISVFTHFRLSQFIANGFQTFPTDRLQHFAGELFGVFTYLPIGLMNTHLTYGGLFSLFFPGIFLYLFFVMEKKLNFGKTLLIILFFASAFVFFYNQSRSAWIGAVFSTFLIFLKFFESIFGFFKKHMRKALFLSLIAFLISLISFAVLVQKNWLLKRALAESIEDNTTENQRYFIHKINFDLIKKNFFFGVGPGNFSNIHWNQSEELIRKTEELWYELSITPRGHAHHDLLHLQSIGGIFSSVLFFIFWVMLLSKFFQEKRKSRVILFAGIFSILPAGFFQCYFQDDEVALPFCALIGLFSSGFSVRQLLKNRRNIRFAFFCVSLFFFFSIFFIFSSTRKNPEEIYKRKIKTLFFEDVQKIRKSLDEKSPFQTISKIHAEEGFVIEGCLTHRFSKPPIFPRKEDFILNLEYPLSRISMPSIVKITVYERDAFDQDQLYKVHSSRKLREYEHRLKPGTNLITLPGILSEKISKGFPENIFFRDFKFQFLNSNGSEILLPKILFGRNCGIPIE